MSGQLSKLDQIFRRILVTKFFIKGWGEPDKLRQCLEFRSNFLNRETCKSLLTEQYSIEIFKENVEGNLCVLEGRFRSPLAYHMPTIVEPPVDTAQFQVIVPRQWMSLSRSALGLKPLVIQLAGTGDHFFRRRKVLMAKPLIEKHGIASLLLENPFYGDRRPHEQRRSSLCNVLDLFIMGGCLILECNVLLDWCERQGFGPLGLHGLSMGGHMASLAAGSYSKPVALIPCLSWSTASSAFTQGVMSNAVPWSLLHEQFGSTGLNYNVPTKSNDMGEEHLWHDASRMKNDSISSRALDEAISQSDGKGRILLQTLENRVQNFIKLFLQPWLVKMTSQSVKNRSRKSDDERAKEVTLQLLRTVMDDFTHLGNFPKPIDPSLIIAVVAKRDAYLPRDGFTSLNDIWPEAELRYVDFGHIGAFLFAREAFRQAISDALDRMATKYPHLYNGEQ